MGFPLQQILVFLVLTYYIVVTVQANSLSFKLPQCADDEKFALLQFNQSFEIDCNPSISSSAYAKSKFWLHENCCSWEGVKCNEETGYVTELDLSSSCLYGTFPSNSTLFSLVHLQELNLADNYFESSLIPREFGQLQNLKGLNLSMSAFYGQIPAELSRLSKLLLIDLSENGLYLSEGKSFQRLVQNLTCLEHLHLDLVDISSPVPAILTNLTSLRTLSLKNCKLYGHFPASIFHLPHLEGLYMSNNENLAGVLPQSLQKSPFIEIYLDFTMFSGVLPPSIGNLTNLETLCLFHASFSGPIPSSLGDLTKITFLDLSYNDFSGDIPSSLANLTQLQALGLSSHNASRENLYSWVFKLDKLEYIGLTEMSLGGEVPSLIANLTGLMTLELGGNQLTGHVPQWLQNLTELQLLIMENNQLKGSISQGISGLANLKTLYIGNNDNLYANFDAFLKHKYLTDLDLVGVTLTFPPNISANDSVAQFASLDLSSCNLTEFPRFLEHQKNLQDLDLSSNKIHGLLPQWFVDASQESLYSLDISNNFLTGFELPVVSLPWSQLEILYLQHNWLQGPVPIPSNSLVIYQVSNNLLSGGIPQQFCKARSLNYLDISNNMLAGRIPSCISDLGSSLIVLNLLGNNFHGIIPRDYPKDCMLKMINLSENQLEGSLPRSLVNCTMLGVLDVGHNHVNDTFPSWLGSLPDLRILILRHNNFHGKIGKAKSSFGFQCLRIIDLSHNFHTGELPSDYLENWDAMKIVEEHQSNASSTSIQLGITTASGYSYRKEKYNYSITIANKGNDMLYSKILTVFRVVDLSSNNFTGSIPDLIGSLKGLQVLNLSNNNLNGNIPQSLAYMIDMESLDLSKNMLSGEIPQRLTELEYLEVFNVSHNLLIGPIPQGSQFNAFDNSSFAANTGLCGGLLSKKCRNEDKPAMSTPTVTTIEKEDDSTLIDWIIRSLGCVSGFIVGCAIGKYTTDRNHEWFLETFGQRRRTRKRGRRSTKLRQSR